MDGPQSTPINGYWSYSDRKLGPSGFSKTFAKELGEALKAHELLQEDVLCDMLDKAASVLRKLPNVVEVRIPPGADLHIVGDIHGQYFDLHQIIEAKGEPGPLNQYVFNGDFVDRGMYSVEVATLLLALKVAYPNAVHLNRGNHEVERINSRYGFRQEVSMKYSSKAYTYFTEAFVNLPLATLVNDKVLILHGGLPTRDGVTIKDMQQISRKREPDIPRDDLMMDILWSDPMPFSGRSQSPRGAGVRFGPNVTDEFCDNNGLLCIVRSHEVKDHGFEWDHERCLTVFSAANYCGVNGNLGAVIDVKGPAQGQDLTTADLKPWQFQTAQPIDSRRMRVSRL